MTKLRGRLSSETHMKGQITTSPNIRANITSRVNTHESMSKLKGKLSAETHMKGQITTSPNILVNMTNGARGKSAYEVWLGEGNTGTVEDFLESLKGSDGAFEMTDYNKLREKPRIEEVELVGNTTFEELGITSIGRDEINRLL